jgi:hypothetical protein
MYNAPVVSKNTDVSPVPNGRSDGLADWFGRLFVPDEVEKGWIENDAEIRRRAQNDASSKEIQARVASSAAMAKSAANVRVYTSAPFTGEVLTGGELATIAGEAALEAPKVLISEVSDKVIDPLTDAAGKAVRNVIPWQVWLIVGAAVFLGVGIFSYLKGKT